MTDRSRIGLAIAASLAVLALVALQFAAEHASAGRRISVGVDDSDPSGVRIAGVLPGGAADRAGMKVGDRIVSVAARPIAEVADYDDAAEGFVAGREVPVVVERDGVNVDLLLRPGAPMRWRRLVPGALSVLGYLAVALLALLERGGDRRSRLLFVYSLAVALELALPVWTAGDRLPHMLSQVAFCLLSGLEVGLELDLVLRIPRRPRWLDGRAWLIPAFYAAGLGLGLLGALSVVSDALGLSLLPWDASATFGVFNIGVLPAWSIAVTALLTAQVLGHSDPLGRQQAGLVLAGEIPWMVFNVLSGAGMLLEVPAPDWVDFVQPAILLCFPVAIFVAVFRYHLFDIERAVRRGLVYTTLTSALVLGFYVALGTGSAVLSQRLEGGLSIGVVAFATLLLGLAFSPLRAALQRLIDRRFFPERSEQRARLVALAAELPALGNVPAMGRHLAARLSDILAVPRVTLLVAEPRSQVLVTVASTAVNPERDFDQSFLISSVDPGMLALTRARRPLPAAQLVEHSASLAQRLRVFEADLVAPLLESGDLVGVLLLGGRVASRYLAEELALLNLLCHHVTIVFENARLFDSATFDGLTGLARRESILEQAEREVERALRYGRPLAFGMADLDNFKDVNDSHGHLAGDAVLKRVAQALEADLRSADAVGRWGGEEFLLVLPETDLEGARAVAEKIRAAVDAIRLTLDDGATLRVTISIGLATLDDADTTIGLIHAADQRLLAAKAGGRNRVEPSAWVPVPTA